MITYHLTNGYSVRTTAKPGGHTEFETRNPTGETVSTVTLPLEEAERVTVLLRTNEALGKRAA